MERCAGSTLYANTIFHKKWREAYSEERVAKTEGASSTPGPPRVTARGPGGRDIQLDQHIIHVLAASAGAVLIH